MMRTEIATLRRRIIQLLTHHKGSFGRRLPPPEPQLPVFTPQLFKLAHIAVGDPDNAANLVAEVLTLEPADEIAAAQALVACLPQGWHSWPDTASPSQWLRLQLRREQANRLLSVLGEWQTPTRLGLALYLLWDVRLEELDHWLGISGMTQQVSEALSHVGRSLELMPGASEHPTCVAVAPDLLYVHDPQIGRTARLHVLGCDICRQRSVGLDHTIVLLRQALDIFFRTPFPTNLPQRILRAHQQRRQRTQRRLRPVLLGVLLTVALVNSVLPKPAVEAQPAVPPPLTASELIDRALHRFNYPLARGVLHERIQIGTETPLVLERWYDYTAPQRFRITLRRPKQETPILDLNTDGTSRVALKLNPSSGAAQSALIRDVDVARLMPVLRQLPMGGSFSNLPVKQRELDIALLAAARRSRPTLLGNTIWQGRPASMVAADTPEDGRLVLTIDRETLSLLDARMSTTDGPTSTMRRVWRAEVVEVLPRTELPRDLFDLVAHEPLRPMINPRQLGQYAPSNLNINAAVTYTPLPMPETLPEPLALAYVRTQGGLISSVLQMYESEWSTIAIDSPRIMLRPFDVDRLDLDFAHGRYRLFHHPLIDATIAEFVMDDAPDKRMILYLWHALLTKQEREERVQQLLDSMTLVDATNIAAYQERFSPSPTSASQPTSTPRDTLAAIPQPRTTEQRIQQRIARLKQAQLERLGSSNDHNFFDR